jgi:hypothetical protein
MFYIVLVKIRLHAVPLYGEVRLAGGIEASLDAVRG